jgi:hypothetical protein
METKTLIQKIHALQSEVGAIAKNATNPFYKSKYFDINGLIEHLSPLLQKHELVIMQPLTTIDGKPAITTTICSTEACMLQGNIDVSISSSIVIPELSDPQKMGSAITYYRRYALQSFLLLQAEDDDANLTKPSKATPQVTMELPTISQLAKLKELQFLLNITTNKVPESKQQADLWIKGYEAKLEEQK